LVLKNSTIDDLFCANNNGARKGIAFAFSPSALHEPKGIAFRVELAVFHYLNLYRFNSIASALVLSEIMTIRPY
jgi:hypothetical protein